MKFSFLHTKTFKNTIGTAVNFTPSFCIRANITSIKIFLDVVKT